MNYLRPRFNTLHLLVTVVMFFVTEATVAQDFTEVVYKEVDTVRLKMEIYKPLPDATAGKRPAIIFFFGGGWRKGSVNQFRPFATYYAARGFVTVLADYRVFDRHSTTPLHALKDAKSAIRYLRIHAAELGIDPDCIVGSGGSAGGHLAAACYTNNSINEDSDSLSISPKPNAMVLFNPVIDNSKDGFGYERVRHAFPDFSPLHAMSAKFPPTIFFLGSKDALIPVSTADAFKAKIESTGSICELHLFEGEGHGFFNKPEFRAEILPLIDKFLTRAACIGSKIKP